MSAWWWWWRRGGTPPDPAQVLLDEAAVRFDFSQYTDINDMVDVNGGWGPIVPDPFGSSGTQPTMTLIAEGLRFTGFATNPATTTLSIGATGGVSGPLSFTTEGLTYLSVTRILTAWNGSNSHISAFNFLADYDNDGAPGWAGQWLVSEGAPDAWTALLQGGPPGFASIVDDGETMGTTDPATVGEVFLHVATMDVAEENIHQWFVTPDGTTQVDSSMSVAPGFTDNIIDYFARAVFSGGTAPNQTWIECDAWNRILTPTEVDTLVAHFQA